MSWLMDKALTLAPVVLPGLLRGKVKPETLDWIIRALPGAVREAEAQRGVEPRQALRNVIEKTRLTSAQIDDMISLSRNPTLRAVLDRVAPGAAEVIGEMRGAEPRMKRASDYPALRRK